MAQLALSAHNQAEVTSSIARGMEILGPSISLDTLVTALVIRVGTLSGVHRLESLCSFAVMSVIVNYVVFMTFYPACLSLILELTRNGVDVARSVKARGKDSLLMRALYDEDQKPNPVVQRVKIIMSTGLIIVHAHRYRVHSFFFSSYIHLSPFFPSPKWTLSLSVGGRGSRGMRRYPTRTHPVASSRLLSLQSLFILG